MRRWTTTPCIRRNYPFDGGGERSRTQGIPCPVLWTVESTPCPNLFRRIGSTVPLSSSKLQCRQSLPSCAVYLAFLQLPSGCTPGTVGPRKCIPNTLSDRFSQPRNNRDSDTSGQVATLPDAADQTKNALVIGTQCIATLVSVPRGAGRKGKRLYKASASSLDTFTDYATRFVLMNLKARLPIVAFE